jgi:hypothetical protein
MIMMYILIMRFEDRKWEDGFWAERQQGFPELNLPLNSSWTKFLIVPKYLNFATIQRIS